MLTKLNNLYCNFCINLYFKFLNLLHLSVADLHITNKFEVSMEELQ